MANNKAANSLTTSIEQNEYFLFDLPRNLYLESFGMVPYKSAVSFRKVIVEDPIRQTK